MSDGYELLPCPFCGGEAEIHAGIRVAGEVWAGYAVCTECGAEAGYVGGIDRDVTAEIAEKWNRRETEVCRLEKRHWDNGECTRPASAGSTARAADGR